MGEKQIPHLISGTITNGADREVILDNLTTGESITTTSNASGQYIFDCVNLASGYSDEDSLIVRTSAGTMFVQRRSATIGKTSLFQVYNIDKLTVI